jgi:hypothetical protein
VRAAHSRRSASAFFNGKRRPKAAYAHAKVPVRSELKLPLTVDRADASAVPFVMATERTAGFEQLVGRWDEARHRAALTDGRHVYFIGRDGTEPVGFVIENTRARRAYEAVGFQAEGIARGSAFFHGVHRDELVMAVLRPEWKARAAKETK